MELAAGTVLGRYVVEGPLGEGGMAVVYRVRHERLGTVHALKLLHRADRDLTRRLLREGRLQGAIKHPHVVSVTDVVDVGGAPGLVAELVEGTDLGGLIRMGPLELDVVDSIARQVLRAMAAAHQQDVVHRDLKPSNVLIGDLDGHPVAKVSDFGLAKALSGPLSGTPTRANLAMGTPGYMAPEQARDAGAVDARADVFALGALLYEALTGRRAFTGANVLEAITKAMRGRYTPVEALRPDAPRRMIDTIAAALHPKRDDRPADAGALLALWTAGAAGDVVAATPPLTLSPFVPPSPSAVTRAWASEPDIHPPRDRLLGSPDAPDIVGHLRECPECRIDVKLYAAAFGGETLAVDPGTRSAARRWGVVGAAGSAPLVYMAFTTIIGPLDLAGAFGIGLAALTPIVIGSLVTRLLRARRGDVAGLLAWLVGPMLLLFLGDLGTLVGMKLVSDAVSHAPLIHRAQLLASGLNVALSSAAFGHLAVLLTLSVSLVGLAVLRARRRGQVTEDVLGRAEARRRLTLEGLLWVLGASGLVAVVLLLDVQVGRSALLTLREAGVQETVAAAERFALVMQGSAMAFVAVGLVVAITGAALTARRIPHAGRLVLTAVALWVVPGSVGGPAMGLQRAMSADVVPSYLAVAVDRLAPGLALADSAPSAGAPGAVEVFASGDQPLAVGDRLVALDGRNVASVAGMVRLLQACTCATLGECVGARTCGAAPGWDVPAMVWRAAGGRIEEVPLTVQPAD